MQQTSEHTGLKANVLVVDDHTAIRKGVRAIMSEAGLLGDFEEAVDGLEGVAMACNRDWDVVLLDISLPKINGLGALARIKACRPGQCVVMLSTHASPMYVRMALKAGASGYVRKENAPDELVAAIRTVLAGKIYVSHDLAGLF